VQAVGEVGAGSHTAVWRSIHAISRRTAAVHWWQRWSGQTVLWDDVQLVQCKCNDVSTVS